MYILHDIYIYIYYIGIPVVPARGGAEVALKIYIRSFSSIELACAVRQPSPCVRALCESHIWSSTSHFTLLPPALFTLHSAHFSLHTALFPIHTSHFTLHTSHFTLHSPHYTVHTSHFSLLTASFTLQTSHCILHAPHFTLHSSHPTLHLIWALLTLSQLSSSHLISSRMSSKLSCVGRTFNLSRRFCTSARLSVTHFDSSTCQKA